MQTQHGARHERSESLRRHPLRRAAWIVAAGLVGACGGGGGDDTNAASGGAQAVAGISTANLAPAPSGLSGNVTCTNWSIGAVSLDTVIVPDNAACRLEGTVLIGSILVGTGATLEAVGVRVNGSLQAEGSRHVALVGGSTIGGSVQVKQGGSATIENTRITGDLQLDAMRGALNAAGNRIGGNLQAVGNSGGLNIERNTMDGNLQCKENRPAPSGGGNVATIKEDQCRDL